MAPETVSGEAPRAAPYEQAIGPYLRAVRRNWKLVLIVTVLAGGVAAFTVTRIAKQYQASSSIYVTPLPQGDPSFVGIDTVISDGDPTRTIENAAALIDSSQAAAGAARTLGRPWTTGTVFAAVSVVPRGASDVLAVTATASSPRAAQRVANAFATSAIAYRAKVVQSEIAQTLATLETQLKTAKGAPASTSSEATAAATTVEQLKAVQSPGHEPTMAVSQLAGLPSTPTGAPSWLVVALGLIGGLALGSIAALGLETFGRPIRDRDEIEQLYPLPVLATIPRMHVKHGSKGIRPWEFTPVAFEQMRMLRVQLSLELSIVPTNPVIMVTSACAGDGKTTVAAALAAAFAEIDQDVILMDLDMRRPQLSSLMDIEPTDEEPGELPGRGVPMPVPRIPRVKVISAPRGDFSSFEALLQRLPELLVQARRSAGCVIVDTAPVGEVSESLRIAAMCDQVLFVARPRETDRKRLMLARDLLTRAAAPVVGMVLVGRDLGMPESSYASPYTSALKSPNGADGGAGASRVAEVVADIAAEPPDSITAG